MARSIVSRVMLASRAAVIAARRRGLDAGSGEPKRADVVISRISLVKILARWASWRPLRCMMFLNCEWPAIARSTRFSDLMGRLYHFSWVLGVLETVQSSAQQKRRGPKPPLKNVGT